MRASNRSFALVRHESSGVDYWEVWDERMPFGSGDRQISVVVNGFWFLENYAGDWTGPFRSPEHAYAGSTISEPRPCLARA